MEINQFSLQKLNQFRNSSSRSELWNDKVFNLKGADESFDSSRELFLLHRVNFSFARSEWRKLKRKKRKIRNKQWKAAETALMDVGNWVTIMKVSSFVLSDASRTDCGLAKEKSLWRQIERKDLKTMFSINLWLLLFYDFRKNWDTKFLFYVSINSLPNWQVARKKLHFTILRLMKSFHCCLASCFIKWFIVSFSSSCSEQKLQL